MGIVLSILQILGWILLSVLLIVLAALLIIVFCPVHYQIEGEWIEEKWVRCKVHWLLHLLRAKVSYGDDLIYAEIHIFWKKITFSHDLSDTKEDIEDALEEAGEEFEENVVDEETIGESLGDEDAVKDLLSDDEVVKDVSNDEEAAKDSLNDEEAINDASNMEETIKDVLNDEEIIEDDKPSVEDVVQDTNEDASEEMDAELVDDMCISESENTGVLEEKIIGTETAAELRGEAEDVFEDETLTEEQKESIFSKIKGILERIREIYSKIKPMLEDKQNKDAVRHLKNEVIYLLKIFIPKKSKIDAVFSTGSPDKTGQVFGVLACVPAMYRNEWKLVPDFQAEEAYLKGGFWCKGWIAVYQFVGIVLRILFDKNCRRLYTMIKKFLKWIKKEEKSEEEK